MSPAFPGSPSLASKALYRKATHRRKMYGNSKGGVEIVEVDKMRGLGLALTGITWDAIHHMAGKASEEMGRIFQESQSEWTPNTEATKELFERRTGQGGDTKSVMGGVFYARDDADSLYAVATDPRRMIHNASARAASASLDFAWPDDPHGNDDATIAQIAMANEFGFTANFFGKAQAEVPARPWLTRMAEESEGKLFGVAQDAVDGALAAFSLSVADLMGTQRFAVLGGRL